MSCAVLQYTTCIGNYTQIFFCLLCLTRVIRYQKNLKNKISRVIFLVLSGAFSVELNWDELNISSDVVIIVTNHWEWASRLTEWNLWHKFSHADKFYVFIGALFDQYIQAHIRADQILKPTHKSVWCNLLYKSHMYFHVYHLFFLQTKCNGNNSQPYSPHCVSIVTRPNLSKNAHNKHRISSLWGSGVDEIYFLKLKIYVQNKSETGIRDLFRVQLLVHTMNHHPQCCHIRQCGLYVILWLYIWTYGYLHSKYGWSFDLSVARDNIIMFRLCWWTTLDSFCIYLMHKLVLIVMRGSTV